MKSERDRLLRLGHILQIGFSGLFQSNQRIVVGISPRGSSGQRLYPSAQASVFILFKLSFVHAHIFDSPT